MKVFIKAKTGIIKMSGASLTAFICFIMRADFTTIAGGIVPGLILLRPDLPENKDDWPFFWGENEVTLLMLTVYSFPDRVHWFR